MTKTACTSITIQLNGKPIDLEPGLSLADVIRRHRLDPQKAAVEHNLNIVPRSQLEYTQVADGDRIELVEFVGGG